MAPSRTALGKTGLAGAALGALLLVAACQEDTRPESFGLLCAADPTLCKPPFTCLETEYGRACTIQCADDSQCPEWYQGGRCPGEKISTCVGFVCDPMLCR